SFQSDIPRLVDGLGARRGARLDEVLRNLGLAVDGDAAAGEALEVDAVARAAEGEVEAVVHQALGFTARADAGALEKRHRAAFEHPRAHAREHVLLRAALE